MVCFLYFCGASPLRFELIMSQASDLYLTCEWLVSQSLLGPLHQNSVESISSFGAELVLSSSSAVSARSTCCHDASCAVSGIQLKREYS